MTAPRPCVALALTALIGCGAYAGPGPASIAAPPVAVPATAPAPAPSPAATAAPSLRLYGFFKPTVIASSGAVESYGQPNAAGITNAGNPVYATLPERGRLTFQMAQSRLGLWIGEDRPLKGQVEIDFVDITKASPTTSLPRLRIAKLAWRVTDELTVIAGQDWQLYQPINPHGADYIGALMEAGNSAFVRQHVRALWSLGAIELGAEIGMQSPNSLAKDGATELSFTPSFALRAQYNVDAASKLGVDGIASSLLYNPGTPDERRSFAGAAGVYGDLALAAKVNLRFEAYLGQNTANLSLLTLGQGRPGTDVRDAGGFVSAKIAVTDRLAPYARFGAATVLDSADVLPAYAYATSALGVPPALSSATLAGTGPGIRRNITGSVGVDLALYGGLSLLAEGFWYRTRFALLDVDAARVAPVSQVVGAELALLWLL